MTHSPLLGPAEIRNLAHQLGVHPTKKLGQNFVIDGNTVRRIVALARVGVGDEVLEVGPGFGSLTLGLLESGAHVTAVEIDRRLAAQLPVTIAAHQPNARLTVVNDDALRATTVPGTPTKLVANLPYNISVPVLIHLLECFSSVRAGLVMVQAEVGRRLAASPGTKDYGGPSVKAAWFGSWRIVGAVSRTVFWPVPHVDSVLVAFERHVVDTGDDALRAKTFELVDATFRQRRKMLRQSLAALLAGSDAASDHVRAAGLDPTARGEQLTLTAFVSLSRAITASEGQPRSPNRSARGPLG